MTKKDELIAKMEEYIETSNKLMGNWESSHILLVNIRQEIDRLKKEIEKEEKRKYDANTCCVCHINYVDSASGYDTCESCSRGI